MPSATIPFRILIGIAMFACAASSPCAAQKLGDPLGFPQSMAGPPGIGAVPATFEARFAPAEAGSAGQLMVAVKLEEGWHIYSVTQPAGGPIRTKITLDENPSAKLAGDFTPSVAPKSHAEAAFNNLIVEEHGGKVVWVAPLEIATGVDPATLEITGKVYGQLCDASGCLPPKNYPFTAKVGARIVTASVARPPAPGGPHSSVENPTIAPGAASPGAFDPKALEIQNSSARMPLALAMLYGLLGGFILNFMPCVLPVIGLKVLSFVAQSGKSKSRVMALNVAYSAGLMAVFMILATLAAFASWSWGQQATYASFNITLAAVVFAMGLSFLGVWEIPIPGFVGRGPAVDLADREGYSGAFLKGCITTVLAVPCSGPFLASALTWAAGQPPALIYAVFGCIGLGMAAPYLVAGVFPGLLGWLPKPGAWMETFKQLMGFILLGTVVYLLTFVPHELVVPTIALLFGLWAACWWIGRTPLTSPSGKQLAAWAQAGAFGLVIAGVSLGWLAGVMRSRFQSRIQRAVDNAIGQRVEAGTLSTSGASPSEPVSENHLPWQPYSVERLAQLTSSGRTVMIDFTADW